MKNWEKATNKFLEKWKDKDYVIGAIACGSYVTGRPTQHSDIDLRIIMSNDVDWRERGNEIVDGFLIEYFANPIKQELKYMEGDFQKRRKIDVHMYLTGKILFDKTGDVAKLLQEAKKWGKKKFPKAKEFQKQIARYSLWDMQDNLEEVYERGKNDFYYVYYNFLENILWNYCSYLGYAEIPAYKARRFLTEKKDMEKYHLEEFPDKKFVKMFINAINLKEKEEMLKQYQNLSEYVLKQMDWKGIDGWKFRGELDK
jgi:predicted nucleotidyltransferase